MNIKDMLATPVDDEPVINAAIERVLAVSGYDAAIREITLQAWLIIGVEYLARETGRKRAGEVLDALQDHVKTAQPSKPWPK